MLQQYLQAEVVNTKAVNDVLIFLDFRLREMIRETLDTLGGKWEIPEDDQPLTKSNATIQAIEVEYDEVVVWFMKDNATTVSRRNISSENWYTEDLVTILGTMTDLDKVTDGE